MIAMKTIHPVWLLALFPLSFFCAALSIQALAEPPAAKISAELLRDPQFQAGF